MIIGTTPYSNMNILYLISGGVLGTLARYFFSGFVGKIAGHSFPYGTWAVNLAGCFLIGCFAAWAPYKTGLSTEARLFLMTGFCGAFTTFSTFMLEINSLLEQGRMAPALLYIFSSLVFGFLVFKMGSWVGTVLSNSGSLHA